MIGSNGFLSFMVASILLVTSLRSGKWGDKERCLSFEDVSSIKILFQNHQTQTSFPVWRKRWHSYSIKNWIDETKRNIKLNICTIKNNLMGIGKNKNRHRIEHWIANRKCRWLAKHQWTLSYVRCWMLNILFIKSWPFLSRES